MNALEIADALEESYEWTSYEGEAVAMLRQQHEELACCHDFIKQYQAEIESLKTDLSFFQKEKSKEELKLCTSYMKQVDSVNISKEYVDETQNNRQEPVAWMETYKGEPNNLDWDKNNLNYGDSVYDVIPLYTEPQYRELSDEEIISYASKAGLLNYVDNETPRRYWIDDRNEVEDLVKFVQDMIAKSRKNCGD